MKEDTKLYVFAVVALLIVVAGFLAGKHIGIEHEKSKPQYETEEVCEKRFLRGKVCTKKTLPREKK